MSLREEPPRQHFSAAGTAALFVIGLLVLVPSGLCTGILGGGAILSMLTEPKDAGSSVGMLAMALVVGGPFVIGGGVMVWRAIARMRGH
jgi:hypothetical protein